MADIPGSDPRRIPTWLSEILGSAASPRAACDQLLFHGTIESFEGRLVASKWESLRWTAEDPCVAQSYCPETGGLTGWAAEMAYEMDRPLLPQGPINAILFRDFGFDEADLDATTDHTGRYQSYRILPNHPTNQMAADRMRELGYKANYGTMDWVKVGRSAKGDVILPADHKDAGRLFILERPVDLRIHDISRTTDGGLTGRQWTQTDAFHAASQAGWDGIQIDDIHQSKQLGHFGHVAIGLFEPTLARLRYHVLDIVHFDPWDCWKRQDDSTTPEFDALWASCRQALSLAA
jgi:hypothetical protein